MKNKKIIKLTNEEEVSLVKDYLAGNGAAFNPLFYKYKNLFFVNLYKWHKNCYPNPAEVDDMAMEFLGRISSKLHLYDSEKAQFNTWMVRSMENYMKEYWKTKNRQKRKGYVEDISRHSNLKDNSYDTIKKIEQESHRKLIRKMIESLGSEDTRIFYELIIKGETQEVTRKKLGLKRSTMSYRFVRMLKRLEKFRPEGY